MAQRTVSIPQIQSLAKMPILYEALVRLRDGVNRALTLPTANGTQVKAKATIVLTNPVTRVVGPGTVRAIAAVDFGVPVWLIAQPEDVELAVGGNIGSAVTISAGTAVGLILETSTGLYWPVGGA